MTRRVDSVEKEILQCQLAMKDTDSHSWTTLVRELPGMYGLCSVYDILYSPPPPRRPRWKAFNAVAFLKSTLKFLNLDSCTVGKVHPLWQCGHDPFEVTMVDTKARVAVLRYGLYSSHCAGKKKCIQCPLCDRQETMVHFLLHCPTLQHARSTD